MPEQDFFSQLNEVSGKLGLEKPTNTPEMENTKNQKANAPNIGWKYNYAYFKGLKWEKLKNDKNDKIENPNIIMLKKKNEEILNFSLSNYRPNALDFLDRENDTFLLTTTYPGLIAGSGYPHEISVEGEFKLGCFFDHSSGLPVIPGSSVKGVLRSAFKHPDFIKELWKSLSDEKFRLVLTTDEINRLELEIFEAEKFIGKKKEEKEKLKPKDWDIFYDAVLEKGQGKFLGNDYITPHINRKDRRLDPFTNPVPLQFIKVLPEIKFRFQFDLKNSQVLPQVTKKHKTELFKSILLHLGIGAKTNVGYGQFQ